MQSIKTKQHTIYKNKNDKEIPSVTTIIGENLGWGKEALMKWASVKKLNYEEIRDNSASIGTITHEMIHCYLTKKPFPMFVEYSKEQINEAKDKFNRFLEWEKGNPFQLIASEILLVSEKYQYGGTIDIIGILNIDNNLSIIDIKTSNWVWPEMLIQIAAYGKLWEENNKTKIQAYYILNIDRLYGFKYLDNEFDIFLNLLNIAKKRKMVEGKIKKERR